jgi:uncharacterized DUF497 family protein
MRFEWDEAKRLQNLKDHGVDFVDAHKVFAGPTFTFEDDRLRYQEQRFGIDSAHRDRRGHTPYLIPTSNET